MMANETRVVLDLSGVETIDSAGLEATVRIMDAIRAFGGSLTIGRGELSVDGAAALSILPRAMRHPLSSTDLCSQGSCVGTPAESGRAVGGLRDGVRPWT